MATKIKDRAFSHNPFMMGYDNRIFEEDNELGFRFPEGKIIGRNKFIGLNRIMEDIKKDKREIVLNIGDSSTSGWNSNIISKDNPNSPFFTYKTYSDFMRERFFVINAGVPGYSSYQGKEYLYRLLKRMASNNIYVDYVTIYFGNNDSTYNRYTDKFMLDRKLPAEAINRVSVKDFKRNIRDMIELCRDYNAMPVLIMPLVNYRWKPGIRSMVHEREFSNAVRNIEDGMIYKMLMRAIKEHDEGNYSKALELDRVLPRIKKEYRKALNDISRRMNIPMVTVKPERGYFVDYCHPSEKANRIIADRLFYIIDNITKKDTPLRYRLLERGIEILNIFIKDNRKKDRPSENIYSLY